MLERLHPHDLERLAELVAELVAERLAERLAAPPGAAAAPAMIDAAEVARRFGVARSFVYDHADELGAVRIGGATRPRLRFDPEKVAAALTARERSDRSDRPDRPVGAGGSQRRRRRTSAPGAHLLPIRGGRA